MSDPVAGAASAEGAVPALLARLPDEVRRRVLHEAVRLEAPEGAVLFRPGDACSRYMLLTAGTVRVQLVTSSGHQIVLYRVEPGETCVLTTTCLLAHEAYAAEGVAETPVRALGLAPALFERLLGESSEFRRIVLGDFGHRLADMMLLLNEVAFRRMDARVAAWLVHTAGREGTRLRHTHQEIAVELGTAREVVSRQLKELERDGLLSMARGRIDLLDLAALRRIASTEGREASRVT